MQAEQILGSGPRDVTEDWAREYGAFASDKKNLLAISGDHARVGALEPSDAYLEKPFSPNALVEKVRVVLRRADGEK